MIVRPSELFVGLPEKVPRSILLSYVAQNLGKDEIISFEDFKLNIKVDELKRYEAKEYLASLLKAVRPDIINYLFETIITGNPIDRNVFKRKTFEMFRGIPINQGPRVAKLFLEVKNRGLLLENGSPEPEKIKFYEEKINIQEFLKEIKEKYSFAFWNGKIGRNTLKAIIDYELSAFREWGSHQELEIAEVLEYAGEKTTYHSLQNTIRRLNNQSLDEKVLDHLEKVKKKFGEALQGYVIVDWLLSEFGIIAIQRGIEFAENGILAYHKGGVVEISDYMTRRTVFYPSRASINPLIAEITMILKDYVEKNGIDGLKEFIKEAKERGEEWAKHVRKIIPSRRLVVLKFGKYHTKVYF